jgi:anaerobic selenocysteine-containing dehydrogenase
MTDGSNGMNRRRFLKVLGVTSGGAAAMSGCTSDRVEQLIPYLVPPEGQVPGIATWYASTCRECPAGCGIHVRVREGRAVKVEGNPGSPVSEGRLCSRGQAALQGLYNPDRIRQPMARTAEGSFAPVTWEDAIAQVTDRLAGAAGDRVRFISGLERGTFDRLLDEWLSALESNGRIAFEPLAHEAVRAASRMVFGVDAIPHYDFAAGRYVLSFGADFLETWGSPVEQARSFAASHGYRDGQMGRYVHIEPRMSMTAMSADEWIAPTPGSEGLVVLGIAHVIVRDGLAPAQPDLARVRRALDGFAPESVTGRTGVSIDALERLAREFTEQASIALPGGVGAQHAGAHWTAAAAALLNYVAGNVNRTVRYEREPGSVPSSYAELGQLVESMRNVGVDVLFVHGANPVHATPPSLGFAEAMRQVGFKVSFARFLDETASECDLILPDHDPLEQWSDYQPRSGVHALQQPVMQPVFDTRQTGDVLLDVARRLGGQSAARFSAGTFKEYLEAAWQQLQREQRDRRPFTLFWTEALQQGGVWSEGTTRSVRLASTVEQLAQAEPWSAPQDDALTLVAYPSMALYDGRGANRPWLQELPDPVTKITWSTWVELHPETAAERGIAEGDIVEVTSAGAHGLWPIC